MKTTYGSWLLLALTVAVAGCHNGPTALSADGAILKERQTAFAKRATIACNSSAELQQAKDLAKQTEKIAFFAYLNGHCGAFDKVERVKILTIEPGDGNQVVVVKDLDDASAPAQLWMESKSLTLNK
jgi:hypothetical protein